MQANVKTYMESEFSTYPPYQYNHTGWSGAAREVFDIPNDINMGNYVNPGIKNYTFLNSGGWNSEGVWGRNPFAFYAIWKYAEIFGGADTLLAAGQATFWEEFNGQPSDTLFVGYAVYP